MGRVREESEEKRRDQRRSEKRKSQKKEVARKGRKVAIHCGFQ